jgi:DNA repair exonuclease SbcCD ATPase subunit
MKILSVSAQNFASYKELDFNFGDQGLCLIAGANGSGKSTLCDLIPWVLFGKTSKGGNVDDIRSWGTTETTSGRLHFNLNGKKGYVWRHRSKGDNDLFIAIGTDAPIRGKDMLDTQKRINEALGTDYDLYCAGAYYSEFSPTAEFFTTTAKNRRAITEQLVDLSLPKRIKNKLLDDHKTHYKTLQDLTSQISTLQSGIDMLTRLQKAEGTKSSEWEMNRASQIVSIERRIKEFENSRDSIVKDECRQCGTKFSEPRHVHNDAPNPFEGQLKAWQDQVNPHLGATKDYTEEINAKVLEHGYLQNELAGVHTSIGDLDALSQICDDFRSTKIHNTIKFVETKTNQLLTDYFDAEIRVEFEAVSNDKLEVSIYKDGNVASITQLSKGQRGILKLCFGVAVMEAVQNHHGINPNCVFFDESLDGLRDDMKLKAYRLFESLKYDSVFVVEHSEALKSCFDTIYTVELVNGESHIAKTQ